MNDKPNNCLGCDAPTSKTYRWCPACHPVCADCGTDIDRRSLRCGPCTHEWKRRDPEYLRMRTEVMRAAHKRGAYDNRYTEEYRQRLSETSKAAWERGVYGEEWRLENSERTKRLWAEGVYDNKAPISDEVHRQHSVFMKQLWQDPEYQRKWKLSAKRRWADPEQHRKHSIAHGGDGIFNEDQKYPDEYYKIRVAIYKRDNHTCQLCYKAADIMHHIDRDKNNNDAYNLVALCRRCHPRVHGNIGLWTPFFHWRDKLGIPMGNGAWNPPCRWVTA